MGTEITSGRNPFLLLIFGCGRGGGGLRPAAWLAGDNNYFCVPGVAAHAHAPHQEKLPWDRQIILCPVEGRESELGDASVDVLQGARATPPGPETPAPPEDCRGGWTCGEARLWSAFMCVQIKLLIFIVGIVPQMWHLMVALFCDYQSLVLIFDWLLAPGCCCSSAFDPCWCSQQ